MRLLNNNRKMFLMKEKFKNNSFFKQIKISKLKKNQKQKLFLDNPNLIISKEQKICDLPFNILKLIFF